MLQGIQVSVTPLSGDSQGASWTISEGHGGQHYLVLYLFQDLTCLIQCQRLRYPDRAMRVSWLVLHDLLQLTTQVLDADPDIEV